MQRIVRLSILFLLLSACRKTVQPDSTSDDALISFICTSPQLINDMSTGIPSYVVIDSSATTNIKSGPGFAKGSQYTYPTTAYNQTQSIPWIYYMHLHPGAHTFTLLDTGLRPRVHDTLNLPANAPTSVYYTDSLGYFRSLVLRDSFNTQDGQVNVRFIDLSPDAGRIFFSIDEKPASVQGFDTTYAYGHNSAFINYPNPVSDSLRINFYQAGDSVDVIARLFLQADPGHAYTFALQGYVNTSPGYTDPLTGNYETPTGGLSVLVYKNY
ncbi:DUF4397 domain-containing protein [Dinghuibacter silviterrae]|uniref:Uncharacterized protein DUF4397 n=1 Tax=Dinghuibacter silviterrae TaxID=1539049 RepID=A0A4R8DH28_9BACT|nr:DUF4397 domain-containing protein [Dinghuibacter silviterrae]TDW96825.1 uncharacterized protein DUF4397 [Dinghuibacter silviterrae]